jgi:trimeric autotransporter adhesin
VVAIGVAGTGSGTSTTYPVTIGLTGEADGLRNGATASVAITTAAVEDALAVPTSALAADGARYSVTVLDGGATEDVTVEVGAVGDVWTEIVSGLEEGQQVVLADLDAPLPSSATDGSSAGTSGSGLPGGGFPGGGRPTG